MSAISVDRSCSCLCHVELLSYPYGDPEDEESVRDLLKDVLETYGYKTIIAKDGEDAIAKYNEHKRPIDMMILDVVMPRKNGREVYNFIREINPDVKALFISGYTEDMLILKGIHEEGLEFIPKPLETQSLMTKIKSMLL